MIAMKAQGSREEEVSKLLVESRGREGKHKESGEKKRSRKMRRDGRAGSSAEVGGGGGDPSK